MATVRIRYLVAKRKKDGVRHYWQPSRALRLSGFQVRRLSDDLDTAMAEAQSINRQLDDWRRGEDASLVHTETLPWLIRLYCKDQRFLRLAPTTRRGYQQCLDIIDGWSGRQSHPSLGDLHRKDIAAFYRELSETPAQANAVIRVLRLLLYFAVDQGLLNENPARKPRLQSSKPRQSIWSDEDVRVFGRTSEALGRASVALAVLLSASLGQRQGDILRMTWSQYDGAKISLRQGKTGVLLSVPATSELRAALEAVRSIQEPRPKHSDTILISEATRQPYKADHFRREFRRIARTAGLDNLQYLDLRRTAVVGLAEAGCTTAEIAAITGHQIDRTAHILETYLPRTAPMADAAIRKLELHKTNKSRLQDQERELDE